MIMDRDETNVALEIDFRLLELNVGPFFTRLGKCIIAYNNENLRMKRVNSITFCRRA